MARIVQSLVSRSWNKVFGGEFSRAEYFGWTIIGNLSLAIAGLVVKGIAASFASKATFSPENVTTVAVVLALVATYWALQVFRVGFFFWCMVRRLHHAEKTAQVGVWYLVVTAFLLGIAVTNPSVNTTNMAVLVNAVFWIWVGVLKPKQNVPAP